MTNSPSEHKCPHCGVWSPWVQLEAGSGGTIVVECDECGESIEDFDELESRPVQVSARIDKYLRSL